MFSVKFTLIIVFYPKSNNLETAGKIKPEQAYQKIKELWKKLKLSKHELKIGENLFNQEFDDDNENGTENE